MIAYPWDSFHRVLTLKTCLQSSVDDKADGQDSIGLGKGSEKKSGKIVQRQRQTSILERYFFSEHVESF